MLLENDRAEREAARQRRVLASCLELHEWHLSRSEAYARIGNVLPVDRVTTFQELPWISARLFKMAALKSIPDEHVVRCLTSSGTSGQAVSRVYLDAETAQAQTRALVSTLQRVTGRRRKPLLILDTPVELGKATLNARTAGTLGMHWFGSPVFYAMESDGSWSRQGLKLFQQALGASEQPGLVFGLTFQVWLWMDWLELTDISTHLDALLIHTGGWKKLSDRAVSGHQFRERVARLSGITRCHDYYGMAEQVGSVFLACEQGRLHASEYNHVLIRDPLTWQVLPAGETGIIQVFSTLPRSYPGYSVLTEDRGHWFSEPCTCGASDPGFEVLGRFALSELRGCSDSQAA